MERTFDTIIKLGVIAILVIAATTMQQYSYYTFVRWTVMTTSIYFSYKAYNKKQIGLLIYFCAVSLLFNPFIPFWFQKETWHFIDYLVSAFTLITLIFDWTKTKILTTLN